MYDMTLLYQICAKTDSNNNTHNKAALVMGEVSTIIFAYNLKYDS